MATAAPTNKLQLYCRIKPGSLRIKNSNGETESLRAVLKETKLESEFKWITDSQSQNLKAREAHNEFLKRILHDGLNHHPNAMPMDGNRVILQNKIDGDDYINASHLQPVDGYGTTKFIAAQGPFPYTVQHFLHMLIEQKVSIVVMVADFNDGFPVFGNCSKYWPPPKASFGTEQFQGNQKIDSPDPIEQRVQIHVQVLSEVVDGPFQQRVLQLTRNGLQHRVTQLQFTAWTNQGVPAGADHALFKKFFDKARELIDECDTPVVVHCSDGVGRTGTFIALHRIFEFIEGGGRTVDIVNVVKRMREDRWQMVENKEQLRFIYEFLKYSFGP